MAARTHAPASFVESLACHAPGPPSGWNRLPGIGRMAGYPKPFAERFLRRRMASCAYGEKPRIPLRLSAPLYSGKLPKQNFLEGKEGYSKKPPSRKYRHIRAQNSCLFRLPRKGP